MPDDGDPDRHIEWVRGFFAALEPHSAGFYVNFTNDDSPERVRGAAYSAEQWARLVGLKAKYDPTNFFRMNANIPPDTDLMKGDRVEVLVDIGNGVRGFDIVASRQGRRLDVAIARGTVEVAELTRGGQVVRSARFMASRVVAVVEYPAAEATRSRPATV